MKLRICGNSIRLRLTRSEVSRLWTRGRVEEIVDFGAGRPKLTYALEIVEGAADVYAMFENNAIRVFVSETQARTWVSTEQIGIESPQTNNLRVLVEKDFACLQERAGENEDDAFPNPNSDNCGSP